IYERVRPGDVPVAPKKREGLAVGVADVDAPVGGGRRRVERAAAIAAGEAGRVRAPEQLAAPDPQRVHRARVVAEVQPPVRGGEAALDLAAGLERPQDVAGLGVHRPHLARGAAAVDAPAVVELRALDLAPDLRLPDDLAGLAAERVPAPVVGSDVHQGLAQPRL